MNKPFDSVRVVIFDSANKQRFLILTEVDDPTNWKLPGGKFDNVDETPDHAAARELAEELQVNTSVVGLTTVGELKNDDGVSVRYIYVGTADKAVINPSKEIAKIKWVTQDTIPTSPNKNHILTAVRLAQAR